MAYRNHAIMLAGGDLVVINDPRDVQKLDWQSNLIWKTSVASDHDVVQARDGTFRLIGFDIMPHRGLDVKFASILELDSGGKVSSRWSTRDHLDEIKHAFDTRSFFDNLIDAASAGGDTLAFDESVADLVDVNEMKGRNVYDYFHANTVGILPENPIGSIDRRFAAGNILICFRNVNQIALLDAHTKDILWAWGEGVLEWPHHPTMLASGNMLIFDNGVRRGYSRVLELNPATGRIEWEYVAPGTFYSPTRGSAQRLPNGNTLVCESDKGVAFEVTREGETVWRWVNPAVKLHRRVLVYRMERLPPETIEPLLARSRS
jgi:hypothetical protein